MGIHPRRGGESWNHSADLGAVAGVIGSPRCREILVAVLRADRTVAELADDLGLEGARVSQCLGALADAGLVRYEQRGKLHVYGPSPRASVTSANGGAVFRFRDTRGSAIVFETSPDELAELVRGDRRRGEPFRAGAEPGVVVRPITPAGVPAPTGGAPRPPRPPSARGSG